MGTTGKRGSHWGGCWGGHYSPKSCCCRILEEFQNLPRVNLSSFLHQPLYAPFSLEDFRQQQMQISSLKRLIACFVGVEPQLSCPPPGFSSAVSTCGVCQLTSRSLGASGWTCGCSELSNSPVDWTVPAASQ